MNHDDPVRYLTIKRRDPSNEQAWATFAGHTLQVLVSARMLALHPLNPEEIAHAAADMADKMMAEWAKRVL